MGSGPVGNDVAASGTEGTGTETSSSGALSTSASTTACSGGRAPDGAVGCAASAGSGDVRASATWRAGNEGPPTLPARYHQAVQPESPKMTSHSPYTRSRLTSGGASRVREYPRVASTASALAVRGDSPASESDFLCPRRSASRIRLTGPLPRFSRSAHTSLTRRPLKSKLRREAPRHVSSIDGPPFAIRYSSVHLPQAAAGTVAQIPTPGVGTGTSRAPGRRPRLGSAGTRSQPRPRQSVQPPPGLP